MENAGAEENIFFLFNKKQALKAMFLHVCNNNGFLLCMCLTIYLYDAYTELNLNCYKNRNGSSSCDRDRLIVVWTFFFFFFFIFRIALNKKISMYKEL